MSTPSKNMFARPGMQMLLGALLFLSLTIISDRYFRAMQLDLTGDGLYTLSEGTNALVESFDEPITLNYYFSRTLAAPYPQLLSYGKRVEDMLRAFAAMNPDNVHLSIIDPEPFSEAEDDAVAAGLKGIPLGDGSTLYLGLTATNSTDGSGEIAFFTEDREKFLEYDLVKLLAGLDRSGQKILGLLTQLPMQFGPGGQQAMMQGRAQPYVLYEQLGEAFQVNEIAPDFTTLPENIDVLMIAHPPALNEDQLFLIDQFVLSGGRTLVFLDPHSEAMDPRATSPNASTLGPLLNAWGVSMPEGKVVGDASLAQRVQMGGYGPDAVKDYVFWLAISDGFLASDDVVSGSVNTLNLASAGVLEPAEGATTRFQPLVRTSAVAMLYDASRAVGVPDPDSLLRDLEPTGQDYVLSVRVQGMAETAFPERVAADGVPSANPAIKQGDINIVITADSDLFDDRFWVQLQELLGQRIVVPLAGNGGFVLNMADHISGTEALIDLRGRGISKRPFEVVDDIRREAEAKYLAEEERLQQQLQVTEDRISQLEAQKPEGTDVLSSDQEAEIDRFRDELLETRKALREVKRALRSEIDSLGNWLVAINVALMPLLIIAFALVRMLLRRKRMENRLA
ncbi:MAG: Gldg family protein [Alphaproteobacteria bacterium]|nr:Gldg family protein [Alphaproteobacteria bacterium]